MDPYFVLTSFAQTFWINSQAIKFKLKIKIRIVHLYYSVDISPIWTPVIITEIKRLQRRQV
jgi:hypothetical protein